MVRRNHLRNAALFCFAMAGLVMVCLIAGCGAGSVELAPTSPVTALYLSDRTITDGNEISNTLMLWKGQRENEAKTTYSVSVIPDYSLRTVDHWGFQCSFVSSGWCNGSFGDRIIQAPVYHRLKFTHKPSDDELKGTARHTLISSDEIYQRTNNEIWKGLGFWYVGYIPSGQIGYPVLVHEIGHLLGRSVDSMRTIGHGSSLP